MEEKEKPWYESEEDRLYEEAVGRVRDGVLQKSLSFEEAAALVGLDDKALRASALEDALKVLIAELHFGKKTPLKDLAKRLKLPLGRLEKAREEMFGEVESAAIQAYKDSLGQSGNA
jgi:hypothetical protein